MRSATDLTEIAREAHQRFDVLFNLAATGELDQQVLFGFGRYLLALLEEPFGIGEVAERSFQDAWVAAYREGTGVSQEAALNAYERCSPRGFLWIGVSAPLEALDRAGRAWGTSAARSQLRQTA